MATPSKMSKKDKSRVYTNDFEDFFADSNSENDPFDSDDNEVYELDQNNDDSDSENDEVASVVGAGGDGNVPVHLDRPAEQYLYYSIYYT